MNPLERNSNMQLPIPKGGHHKGHGGAHGTGDARKGPKAVPPCEKTETPFLNQNPRKIGHPTAVQKPKASNAAELQKKYQGKDREKNAEPSQDVKNSDEKPTEKFDIADYGGSPFGGSNRVFPEVDGFW